MAITIPKRHLAFLERVAESEYPRESCAILLGRQGGEVSVTVRCENVHPEPRRRYEINPRDLIRLQRAAWNFGLEIVGFHHSHPEHDATPSETDLEMAYWVGCPYVITSVRSGRACETRAFRLEEAETGKRFLETEISIRT
jgi:proteasome lid subunit RPN8/RPN11